MNGVLVVLTFEEKVLKVDTIQDGKFEILARLPSNRDFRLSFRSTKPDKFIKGVPVISAPFLTLFTDYKNSSFTITANSIADLYIPGKYKVITSSKNQIDYDNYQILLKKDREDNEEKLNDLSKKQNKALFVKSDSLFTLYTDSLRIREKLNKITHNTVTRNFIADNPNSYVSMYLLSERSDLKSNLAFYQLLYKKADRKYRKGWYGLYFTKRVEQLEKLREKYIKKLEVNALDLKNTRFDYGKYANSKLIVFDLWATWCIPCMEDIPAALKLARELKEKSVSYIFLSYDFNVKYWTQQSQKIGLVDSYYLSDSTRKFLNEELAVATVPRYMVLNNKGEILVLDAPSPSSLELKKLIESML